MPCKCEFVFCQSHSLPEYHECGFDFAVEGKKRLEQKNPGFVKAQLDSI
jgi:predicted nucleic acid binding AN1-type Zn finger protein